MISVLIDHDDSLLAAAISATLERSGDFRIVRSRRDTACRTPDQGREVDVVVADYETGLRLVRGAHKPSAVLILARYASESQIRLAIEQGVSGYLVVGCSSSELLNGLRALCRGRKVFSGPLATRLIEHMRHRPLTRRELAVLSHVVKDRSDKDIGRRLALSAGTVRNYVRSILAKLGAHSRREAAVIARGRSLLPQEPD